MTFWDKVPEKLGDAYVDMIVERVEAGDIDHQWATISKHGLNFEISTAPLGIDGRACLGLSAHGVDRIAEALSKKTPGGVMLCTPKLWDDASTIGRQAQIGPHTLPALLGVPNGAAGMTKTAALAHAEAIAHDAKIAHDLARVQKTLTGIKEPPLMSACCKTYVLTNRYKRGFACEYGWRLPHDASWGSPAETGTGKVVQPAQHAHSYRHFWDYSMGAVFVRRRATLRGKTVDLATQAESGCPSVSDKPVAYVVHPEFSDAPKPVKKSPATGTVLTLGSKGERVREWQQRLERLGYNLAPYGADGQFGKRTHNATIGFQRERGLPPTGKVDNATWLAPDMVPTPRAKLGVTKNIWAKNFRWAKRTSEDIWWIVIHTIETPEASYAADNTALWFARSAKVSAHVCIDNDSTIVCVRDKDIAWTAPGANKNGLHIEHAGYARQSAAQWEDPYSAAMLERSAYWAAAKCRAHDIPIKFVNYRGLLRGEHGITTHAEVSKGPGKGRTNHYDPGPHFPMDHYLARVRHHYEMGAAL